MILDAPAPAGYRFRQLTADDRRAVTHLDSWAFPSPADPDEIEKGPSPLTWDRVVGVEPDGEAAPDGGLAALHASYPFSRFPVPGGTLPTAGLTWVGVHPQHRRRGIATAMIDLHLARCRERGEPLSALFAAEYPIYGRFGYGKAADDVRLTVPRGAALRDVPGAAEHTVRIEHADRGRHAALVDTVHRVAGESVGGTGINRPGWATRESAELQASWWRDSTTFRGGQESRRIVVVERDGEPRGYALLRRKLDWVPTGTDGTVNVLEAVALDAAASRALWGVLLDLDLMTETKPFILAPDDPLLALLRNPRAAGQRRVDNVWIRLVDLPTALAGRRYAAGIDATLAVTDARLPDNAGVWHLRAAPFGAATCERADTAPSEADLALDVRELGAAYLGGTSLAGLAAAGLVDERVPGALAAASTAFGWPVAPVCSWVF
ncbi:putative acetyltransferase [Isoptericola sp. CG 20/1183]|uniref:Acetyltransferase n=1 Tax=Isoptericola halotolerans TaxID=300560 RepID=A0ABX5ED46_9MICO|nr:MULTISPECIES: GNAT family N-acetyltransferase [Isoptericola]PRZ05761.1 putative acetyltransferase [Isoptericola halotolerans]PRZ06329.1 putative acetyltransferase [Isoptericola sp. CG 20/1183]